jgi:FkbM family methyltransferase
MPHDPIFQVFSPVPSVASGKHVYDFIGGATRVAFKRQWQKFAATEGRTVKPGLPAVNEHYVDWIATLRSVHNAGGTFRMAELGAGYAPWLVRAALAARQNPAINSMELLAIEADTVHYSWIKEHFRDNGLDPSAHKIIHGAASGQGGMLRFPIIENPDLDYGASLRGGATSDIPTIEVRAWPISEVLMQFSGTLDFLHVDIQGAEYDTLPCGMEHLTRGVKSIMVGTHISDAHHDKLAAEFTAAGWNEIMNYRGNRVCHTDYGDIEFNDGFLLFANPAA